MTMLATSLHCADSLMRWLISPTLLVSSLRWPLTGQPCTVAGCCGDAKRAAPALGATCLPLLYNHWHESHALVPESASALVPLETLNAEEKLLVEGHREF